LDICDIDQVFKEAQSSAKTNGISEIERVQWEVLKAAFNSSKRFGINQWAIVTEILADIVNKNRDQQDSTFNMLEKEKRQLKRSVILRVCAHVAILFMVTGRVNESNIPSYNYILSSFITHFIETKQADKQMECAERVLFYISYLIGEDAQTQAYVAYVLNVEDSNVLRAIQEANNYFFQDALATKFNIALA
jgi:hypothetical protein